MRIVLTGIIAAIVLAAGLGAFLASNPKLAWQAYSTTSTRMDDPGSNLVGPRWNGENNITAADGAHKPG
jgi:hypothetical protein